MMQIERQDGAAGRNGTAVARFCQDFAFESEAHGSAAVGWSGGHEMLSFSGSREERPHREGEQAAGDGYSGETSFQYSFAVHKSEAAWGGDENSSIQVILLRLSVQTVSPLLLSFLPSPPGQPAAGCSP
jgi:hypothetical protein